MVCDRCKLVIENILDESNIPYQTISLGTVDFGDLTLTALQLKALQNKLESIGFEILKSQKSKVIESIKAAIIELVTLEDELSKSNLSNYIADKINRDYNYLSSLFSKR